jgi:hypothetical protein
LRDGRREEISPSVLRAVVLGLFTLALFFVAVGLASMTGCSPAVDSGIEGTVTIGPTSPVATPGSADDSKPYATELVISPKEGLHLKRPVRVKTGADGSFSVALEPGTYVIEAGGSQSPPTLKPLEVSVEPGRYTTVAVPFDSGIR